MMPYLLFPAPINELIVIRHAEACFEFTGSIRTYYNRIGTLI